jgi:hypothetical protein
MQEIEERQQAQSIVNNVYGGQQIPDGGGIQAGMHGSEGADPGDRSYFVDILRQDYEPGDTAQFYDPESGGPSDVELQHGGWGKRVHRFSVPKKKKDPREMMGL